MRIATLAGAKSEAPVCATQGLAGRARFSHLTAMLGNA